MLVLSNCYIYLGDFGSSKQSKRGNRDDPRTIRKQFFQVKHSLEDSGNLKKDTVIENLSTGLDAQLIFLNIHGS